MRFVAEKIAALRGIPVEELAEEEEEDPSIGDEYWKWSPEG